MNEELIKDAAELMYHSSNLGKLSPFLILIEELVVPEGVHGYDVESMQQYIREALEKRKKNLKKGQTGRPVNSQLAERRSGAPL